MEEISPYTSDWHFFQINEPFYIFIFLFTSEMEK